MRVTPCYVRPWDRGGQIRRVNTANYLVVQTVHQGRDVDFWCIQGNPKSQGAYKQ